MNKLFMFFILLSVISCKVEKTHVMKEEENPFSYSTHELHCLTTNDQYKIEVFYTYSENNLGESTQEDIECAAYDNDVLGAAYSGPAGYCEFQFLSSYYTVEFNRLSGIVKQTDSEFNESSWNLACEEI